MRSIPCTFFFKRRLASLFTAISRYKCFLIFCLNSSTASSVKAIKRKWDSLSPPIIWFNILLESRVVFPVPGPAMMKRLSSAFRIYSLFLCSVQNLLFFSMPLNFKKTGHRKKRFPVSLPHYSAFTERCSPMPSNLFRISSRDFLPMFRTFMRSSILFAQRSSTVLIPARFKQL